MNGRIRPPFEWGFDCIGMFLSVVFQKAAAAAIAYIRINTLTHTHTSIGWIYGKSPVSSHGTAAAGRIVRVAPRPQVGSESCK